MRRRMERENTHLVSRDTHLSPQAQVQFSRYSTDSATNSDPPHLYHRDR
jgi:hypothetical protein